MGRSTGAVGPAPGPSAAPSGPAIGTPIPEPKPWIDWGKLFGLLTGPPQPSRVNSISSAQTSLSISGGAVSPGDVFPEVIGTRLVQGAVLRKTADSSFGWVVVVSVAAGPINAIKEVRINGFTVASSGSITYEKHLGAYDQAVDSTVATFFGNWRLPGKAYVVFRIGFPTIFESISSFSFLVEGRADIFDHRVGTTVSRARAANVVTLVTAGAHGRVVGDTVVVSGVGGTAYNGTFTVTAVPTSTSLSYAKTGGAEGTTADTGGKVAWYSANPALATRWALTSSVHGGKVPLARINETSWDTAATACETLGYTLNTALTAKSSVKQQLEALRGCFQADVYVEDGLYCCLVDVARSSPVIDFVEGHNCAEVEISELASDRRPTNVEVRYADSAFDYQVLSAISEDLGVKAGTVPKRDASYQYDGITNAAQAHKIATYHRKYGSSQPYRFAWKTPQMGIRLLRGMFVTISTPMSGRLVSQQAIIDDFQPIEGGQWSVVAHQYSASAYTADAFTADTPLATGLQNPWDAVPEITMPEGSNNPGKVWWALPEAYDAATLYGASYWSFTNPGSIADAAHINDGVDATHAWTWDQASDATAVLDLGSGQSKTWRKVVIKTSGDLPSIPIIEVSDDGASWTTPTQTSYRLYVQPTGTPIYGIVIEFAAAVGSHRYARVRKGYTSSTSAGLFWIYDVQFYTSAGIYQHIKEFEVRQGNGNSTNSPILKVISMASAPTSSIPFTVESESRFDVSGDILVGYGLCIVVVSTNGKKSSGVVFTKGTYFAPSSFTDTSVARTAAASSKQAGGVALETAALDLLDFPGTAAPAVSASGKSRLYAAVTTGILMISTNGAAFIRLLTDAIGVLLQSSTPGTTQTGHIHVSGSVIAGGDVNGGTVTASGDIRSTGGNVSGQTIGSTAEASVGTQLVLTNVAMPSGSLGVAQVGYDDDGASTQKLAYTESTGAKVYFHPAGMIVMTGRTTADAGWLLCNGASVLRATYPALFAAISTTFGAVDGTHFTLPDLRGRFPIGLAASGTGSTLGGTGGTIDHTHNVDIAATTSGVESADQTFQEGAGATLTVAAQNHTHSTNPASTASTTANPPFQALNFQIKT